MIGFYGAGIILICALGVRACSKKKSYQLCIDCKWQRGKKCFNNYVAESSSIDGSTIGAWCEVERKDWGPRSFKLTTCGSDAKYFEAKDGV